MSDREFEGRRVVVTGAGSGIGLAAATYSSEERIIVGSKNFTEQVILGELMAQAETMFPEKSYQYLMDCKWVSSKVVPERRDKGTFSAWKEVLGAKSERLQDKLLDRYNSGDIANQRELRAEAQGEHGRNDSRGNAIDTVKKTINTLQKIFDSDNNLNYMQKGIIEEVIKLLMQI